MKPLIGITVNNAGDCTDSDVYDSSAAYSRAVVRAGGVPVLLPQEVDMVDAYATRCAGIIFSGGADLRMDAFGQPMHPAAKPMTAQRQTFELALYAALDQHPQRPVLGICLGVQLMAMHHGGNLHQHLPDLLGESPAQTHRKNNRHAIVCEAADSVLWKQGAGSQWEGEAPAELLGSGQDLTVVSSHHQAVSDPGTLRIVARSPEGVIEALDDPARPFYLGVQWHPERGGEELLSLPLVAKFVHACRGPA